MRVSAFKCTKFHFIAGDEHDKSTKSKHTDTQARAVTSTVIAVYSFVDRQDGHDCLTHLLENSERKRCDRLDDGERQ